MTRYRGQLLTAAEIAQRNNISIQTVRDCVKKGRLALPYRATTAAPYAWRLMDVLKAERTGTLRKNRRAA